MLKTISIIPLDLGMNIEISKLSIAKLEKLSVAKLSKYESSIFKEDIIKITFENYEAYIDKNGLGVLLYNNISEVSELNYEVCADLIIEKKNVISLVKDANFEVNKFIETLKCEISKAIKAKQKRIVFSEIPYVDTLHIITQNYHGCENKEELKKCLSALFEATLIDSNYDEDSNDKKLTREEIASHIQNLDTYGIKDIFNASTDNTEITMFNSWEGGFVFDRYTSESEMATILMVYLEYSWCVALYVDTWATKQIKTKTSLAVIEEMEVNLVSSLNELDVVLHFTVPLRYQIMYEKIVELSMLKGQIQQAKNSISKLKQYGVYLRDSNSKRANTIIQVLLFLLALTQAIPLFFDVPIIKVDANFMAFILTILISLFVYLIRQK